MVSSASSRPALPPPGGRFAAAVSRRRALSRDHRVTPTTSPRIRPLSFLEAFTYTVAYLVVTSARDIIENSFPMPDNADRYAGIPTRGTESVSRAHFMSLVEKLTYPRALHMLKSYERFTFGVL